MKDTIDMAREVYGAHTEWTGAPLDRLEQLVALVRADERKKAKHNEEVLMNALWKACGDDGQLVEETIESQGELK
jgi:hypothetical protein